MEQYLNFVARFPRAILAVLTLITIYLGYMTAYLTEDSNPYLLPDEHPARSALFEMREEFTGTYDSILIAVYNDESIFNEASLKALFELTQEVRTLNFADDTDLSRLEQIKSHTSDETVIKQIDDISDQGLNQQDIYRLRALAEQAENTDLNTADQKFLRVLAERLDPIREMAGMAATENVFLDEYGTLRAAITVDTPNGNIKQIEEAVMGNELMDDGVVDQAGKVGIVVLEVSLLQDDAVGQLRAYETVNKMIADYQAANPAFKDEVFVGGVPVFFAEQKKIMDADMATLFPAVLILVSLILAAFFRTVLGVLIPLVNVIMCTVWTLGMMAIVGLPLDLITSVLPVFLITICSSDAIHVLAEYYHQRNENDNQQAAVNKTLRLMASPVILTTIATCITFTVSTMTSISSLRNFGISMSFGMFVAMVISLLLIPAWLSLLSGKKLKQIKAKKAAKDYGISKFLLKVIKPVIAKRKAFGIGFGALLLALVAIGSQVRIDDMGSGYFAKDNTFRMADDFINSHIAGTSPGWIEIDTGTPDGALTPEVVNFVDKLEKFVHEQDNITFSYSVARYIRRINYVFNNMDESHNRLPNELEVFTEVDEDTGETYTLQIRGEDIIRQSVLMYENGGGSDLSNVLSEDFSKTVMLYTMNTTVASDFQAFLDKLEPWLAENTPDGMNVKLAGSPIVWTAVLDELISSQLQSILLAFGCVILVMAWWLKSFKTGLLGALPLAVTVIFYYAIMTVFNIELNIGTAIISFLVLGVVDYSVHYLLRIQHGLKEGLSLDDSLEQALIYSGRSIIANVIVFTVGFIALLFSEFRPIVDLGALVGVSLFISGVMSIFVISLLAPLLVAVKKKVETCATVPAQA